MSNPSSLWSRLAGYAVRGITRAWLTLAYRPKVVWTSEESRKLLCSSPCVIISNHVRGLDGAVIQTVLRKTRCYSLFAKDLEDRWPLLKKVMPHFRMLTVDRQHASLGWLRDCRSRLKDGNGIFLCPEGKCHFDHVMGDFHSGFLLLAAGSGVPVIPIYHNGEYHVLHGRRFRMIVGEPILPAPAPEGLQKDVMERETLEAQETMRQLELRLTGRIREQKEAE